MDESVLYGASGETGLVAAEHRERRGGGGDEVVLFRRRDGRTEESREPFEPFLAASRAALEGYPHPFRSEPLAGGGPLDTLAVFSAWKDCEKAKSWLSAKTGHPPGDPGAPYLFLNDPVHQHLTRSGRTLFRGMAFEDVRRMQVDIECLATEGYEFCNAEREGDRIVAIGLGDQTGWTEALSGDEPDEKTMLEKFVRIVRERDPDVLEGHNLFNFDLPYLAERARRHGVKLALGRDGSAPRRRPSRFSVGERTIAYDRFDVFGRHVVDTMFLLHAYDVTHRSLDGFGLKEAARHFGLAAEGRTYLEGSRIGQEYVRDARRVLAYLLDDVRETRALGDLLSRSSFHQAQMLPYSYQNVCVRGSATRIDALMIREYLRRGHALPFPDMPRPFEGGYTDLFVRGVVRDVHHCDVRSLYPSLMLTRKLAPRTDELGVFLRLLAILTEFRLRAKESMRRAQTDRERKHHDALQSTFKVLINSFYGYLGFGQARFSDFSAAEEVTRQGRDLLKAMIEWLGRRGARPIEIDTDGIYFVPPSECLADGAGGRKAQAALDAFRRDFAASLPEGMAVEFDGEYRSMYSYRMKNYALLAPDGEMTIKGAALKSRGVEPFLREYMEEAVRLRLEGREQEIPALGARWEKAIQDRSLPVEKLAKTERLQDSPSTYAAKVGKAGRPRNAAYELALRAGREYRTGDQLSYYVTGEKATVSVYQNCKLAGDWDAARRDENVAYYVGKLRATVKKLSEEGREDEVSQPEGDRQGRLL